LQGFLGPGAYSLLSITSSTLYYEKARLRSDNPMLLCKEYGNIAGGKLRKNTTRNPGGLSKTVQN
jgi:hypothetical protein